MGHCQVIDLLPAARAERSRPYQRLATLWFLLAICLWQAVTECWLKVAGGDRLGSLWPGWYERSLHQAVAFALICGLPHLLVLRRHGRLYAPASRWLVRLTWLPVPLMAAIYLAAGPLANLAAHHAEMAFERAMAPLVAAMDRTGQPPSAAALVDAVGRLRDTLPRLQCFASLAIERPSRRYHWRDGWSAVVGDDGVVQSVWRGGFIDGSRDAAWRDRPVEELTAAMGKPGSIEPTFSQPWRVLFANGSGALVRAPGDQRWVQATGWSFGKTEGGAAFVSHD